MRTLIATLAALALAAPAAAASGVTGIADQGMQSWSPVAQAYADALGPGVTQARYNAAWDVATHEHDAPCEVSCQRFKELAAWIDAARAGGKRVLISFDRQPGCDRAAPGCPPPAPETYRLAIRAFLARFPDVTELTAWNEPNHHMRGLDGVDSNPAGDPALAAAYWNVLREECPGCTVAAGDLLDGAGGGSGRYLDAYGRALAQPPEVWAIHPYTAVNRGDTRALARFLRRTAPAPVWFTEVGAQHCVGDEAPGDAGQLEAARRLVALLAATAGRVERTYYYELASSAGCTWDSALIAPDGRARPALATVFPATRTAWWRPAVVGVAGLLGALTR